MAEAETRQVVHEVLAALDAADWGALERHPGLYETRQNYHLSKMALPDSRTKIEVEVLQGEWMSCVLTVTGTHTGPLLGIPPTGKRLSYHVLTTDHVVNGVIVQHWAIPDFKSIFEQVGRPLMPTGAAPSTQAPA